MSVHYELPTPEDLIQLGLSREFAITIYVPTSPIVAERAVAHETAKSSFDEASEQAKRAGASARSLALMRSQWSSIANDQRLWGSLSRSLAIFIAGDFSRVFVLPNELSAMTEVGAYFALGQLFRAMTFRQDAFALLLSANDWSLWHATARDRARRVTLDRQRPSDAADANNRTSIRGRDHHRRLGGDEGKKILLETYAKRVSEAVGHQLQRRDPHGKDPLFVFATEPLSSLYREHAAHQNEVIVVERSTDRLTAPDIDSTIRRALAVEDALSVDDELAVMANDGGTGLVVDDLSTIARAAVAGEVRAFVFNFTTPIRGSFDSTTGAIEFEDGHGSFVVEGSHASQDILSRIASSVIERDGDVFAIRAGEVESSIWNGTAVAHLRYAFS